MPGEAIIVSDVNSSKGLKEFDLFIRDRSYVEGHTSSQLDVAVFELFKNPVNDSTSFPNATRWYNHIKYFTENERSSWTGVKKLPDNFTSQSTEAPPTKAELTKDAPVNDEDDDIDLFGSDEEEDPEAARIREERLKAYADKKSKKPALIAKSSIVLDVKPWDDETDMQEMEKEVRSIQMDGLVWGASKLVPLAYSIKKLQIMCVVEDDKVQLDELFEKIQYFEDHVQSVDIAAFNKI